MFQLGKKGITKEYVSPTIEETTEQLEKSLELWQESKRPKEFMEGWKPREITAGEDIPAIGSFTEYGDDTPEKSVMKYLGYIETGNYGTLAKKTTNYDKALTEGKLAGRLRQIFKDKNLVGYELVRVTDNAPAICKIEIKLVFDYNGEEIEENRTFRLIYVDENDDTVARGYKKAEWNGR